VILVALDETLPTDLRNVDRYTKHLAEHKACGARREQNSKQCETDRRVLNFTSDVP